MSKRAEIERAEEAIYSGTARIGGVAGGPTEGWSAFDEDGRLVEVYESRAAARKAVFERHRQGVGDDRP